MTGGNGKAGTVRSGPVLPTCHWYRLLWQNDHNHLDRIPRLLWGFGISEARFWGYPKAIRTDQDPEFTGKALDQWACQHGVQFKLIQAGRVGYNVQTAVDTKHHLIVAHEVTNIGVDHDLLSGMAQQARAAIGGGDLTVIVDRGYFKGEEIRACQDAGITAIRQPRLADGLAVIDGIRAPANPFFPRCLAPKRSPSLTGVFYAVWA